MGEQDLQQNFHIILKYEDNKIIKINFALQIDQADGQKVLILDEQLSYFQSSFLIGIDNIYQQLKSTREKD